MILIWLISVLFIGGLIAWGGGGGGGASESYDKNYPRLIALITVVLDFVLMFMLLQTEPTSAGWVSSFEAEWIPRFGIS
ncbi:MAG: NADH-quinone oxidoreductase subunit M, partial [Pseudohongiellaceae bacterium]